ncbi:hypothetical protein QEN29_25620 [Escherichia coli]|nr:hypothetical protein QEN29_25620 [Escherichia coli]
MTKKQGDKKSRIYKATNRKKLDSYHKKIQDRHQHLVDTSETRFYDNMRHFRDKVAKVYGFLYTAEDKQLFLQVESMHIENGWLGSFLITTVSEDGCKPYKEMKLEVGGFTDGGGFLDMSYDPIIEQGVLIGSTDRDAKSIKLTIKKTNGTIELRAFTRQEYKKLPKPYIMTGDSVELQLRRLCMILILTLCYLRCQAVNLRQQGKESVFKWHMKFFLIARINQTGH